MAAAEQSVWPKPCLLQVNEMPKASVLTLRGHKIQFYYARSWAGDRVFVSQKTRVKSHWGNCDFLKKRKERKEEKRGWRDGSVVQSSCRAVMIIDV